MFQAWALVALLYGQLGWPQIVLIVVAVLLLFGGRKIPELMRGIGQGIREFKKGMNEDKTEGGDATKPAKPES